MKGTKAETSETSKGTEGGAAKAEGAGFSPDFVGDLLTHDGFKRLRAKTAVWKNQNYTIRWKKDRTLLCCLHDPQKNRYASCESTLQQGRNNQLKS